MILGMTTATFTLVHVLISLVAIGSGFIVFVGLAGGKLNGWNGLFLTTTVLTSLTGFLFPIEHLTPGLVIGTLSMIVLAVAIVALYAFHLTGAWRPTYVLTAALALYFNTFVLVVQSFMKVAALHALAPTGKEPPFVVAQLIVLAIFIGLTYAALKNFRLAPQAIQARAA